ncbi:hypothetical protein [Phaeocystidibacter luteus]|uniref:Uncharacterized protein n=1 Tax=Phaeocystidibacter luteus TaxID=911197 RepID=A0A6N6RFU1_9FLAO|nr:hypothetical protein [Phaeocystidibacter luteus]KAB2810022.1 hypothetical protein F8C67_09075 [Phaeocystidibacter luteus]
MLLYIYHPAEFGEGQPFKLYLHHDGRLTAWVYCDIQLTDFHPVERYTQVIEFPQLTENEIEEVKYALENQCYYSIDHEESPVDGWFERFTIRDNGKTRDWRIDPSNYYMVEGIYSKQRPHILRLRELLQVQWCIDNGDGIKRVLEEDIAKKN